MAVSLLPLLEVGLPPLVDLYGHLGRYALQTELAGRPELQAFYSYEWKLVGNLGVDLIMEALDRLPSCVMSVARRCWSAALLPMTSGSNRV